MLSMTTGIDITARMGGQLENEGKKKSRLGQAVKSMLSGEDLFAAIFKAKRDNQQLSLAPEFLGEIVPLDLDEPGFYITRGSFLASDEHVKMTVKYGGVKGFLAKKGLFLMHTCGPGTVFLSSYGAVIRRQLDDGEQFVVDNRYVIAFADTVTYDLVKAAKKLSDAFMSGEGLVNRYTGPGEIIYQTRGKQKQGGFLRSIIEIAT
jgi:uncharacterized protein (TIGR00266 family)